MQQQFTCFGIVNSTPEIKVGASGEEYTRLIIAVPHGDQRNNWLPIILRGKIATNACKMAKRGAVVYVTGYLMMTSSRAKGKNGKLKEGAARAYLRMYGTFFRILLRPGDTKLIPVFPWSGEEKSRADKIKPEAMADDFFADDIELPWEKGG